MTEAAGGSSAALAAAAARARSDPGSCAVVLVEGMSDQAALETLAARRGPNLRDEGVFIVPMAAGPTSGTFLACSARSGRKIHYGRVLAAALELTRLPGPLDGVLSRV